MTDLDVILNTDPKVLVAAVIEEMEDRNITFDRETMEKSLLEGFTKVIADVLQSKLH